MRKVQPKEVDRYGWVNAQTETNWTERKKYTEILRPVVELWRKEEKKEKEGKLWEYYGEIKKGELGSISRYA